VTVRVVCAGLATVDLVYRVDRIPGVDEKAQANSVEIAAGGPAANAAVTAAALGADVTLVSAVGRHPLGDLIRDDLRRHGVRLIDAAEDSGAPPPVSSVAVLDGTGERTVVSRNAGDVAVGVPPDLDLAGADAVLVDGHHPALALAAARAARLLVVDAGTWRPVFADILPRADLVACSAAFRAPRAELLDRVPHVAVTDGPHPVRWRSGGRSGEVRVPPVTAVDTAGAGDVFHGALAVAVARDPRIDDLPAALGYAVAVAGVRVTHRGTRSWLAELSAPGRDRSRGPSSGR
jgi:sugar/nucleoside kinase (ribokinase family)